MKFKARARKPLSRREYALQGVARKITSQEMLEQALRGFTPDERVILYDKMLPHLGFDVNGR